MHMCLVGAGIGNIERVAYSGRHDDCGTLRLAAEIEGTAQGQPIQCLELDFTELSHLDTKVLWIGRLDILPGLPWPKMALLSRDNQHHQRSHRCIV